MGGHGTPPTSSYHQEGEYMLEDEYDLLINDPSNLWIRFYLPCVFGPESGRPFRLTDLWSCLRGARFYGYTRDEGVTKEL